MQLRLISSQQCKARCAYPNAITVRFRTKFENTKQLVTSTLSLYPAKQSPPECRPQHIRLFKDVASTTINMCDSQLLMLPCLTYSPWHRAGCFNSLQPGIHCFMHCCWSLMMRTVPCRTDLHAQTIVLACSDVLIIEEKTHDHACA